MISHRLKQTFDNYHALPLEVWDALEREGEIIYSVKEEVLKETGSTERYLYFILQGSAGTLLWNKNNFICTDLLFENDFLCDYLSFFTRQPTPYQVIAMEDSEMFRISYDRFEGFTSQSPHGDKIWRYATQALYVDKHYQQLQLLTLTAQERYALMLQHQPFVLQRIPQKYIASALGVTPQSLSRMRKPKR